MLLTTIGTGTVSPTAARVCAGHLDDAGNVRLLLDWGSGVLHRMAALGVDWTRIPHVALTHFHPDHICDLPLLVMAWRYGAMTPRRAPAELIGPVGTELLLARLAAAHADWLRPPELPWTAREVAPGEAAALGDRVTLARR